MAGGGRAADQILRDQLASFLRARRSELQPHDVGLDVTGPRRVPGLRRHEVSDRAGISVTLYSWLEQGRAVAATPQVLGALAGALCLDESERRYLRTLTQPLDDRGGGDVRPETLGVVLGALDAIPAPAYLAGDFHDLIAWNRSYCGVFTDPAGLPAEHRNAVRILLTTERLRRVVGDWAGEAARAIALLRQSLVRSPQDPRFSEIVHDLERSSDVFRSEWPRHRVTRFTPHDVVFEDARVGSIRTHHVALQPPGEWDTTVMAYLPLDGISRERVAHLTAPS